MSTFQFHFFWLSAYDIERIFCPKYVHSNGLKLSVALEEFSITSQFLAWKMQKQSFEEISVLSAVFFYWIEVQVITNPSSRLEKHQTFDFLLMTDFLWFFLKKISISALYRYFRKSSAEHTIIIVSVLFHMNMLDQTQHSLLAPFSNNNPSKTGAHFRF